MYFHRTHVWSLGGFVSDKIINAWDFINVFLANKNAYLKAVNVTAHVENDVLESFGHTLVPADKRIVKIWQ